ncbi:hypothetical protein PVAND_016962 [Polypedilum vanderplanki]|uniref:Uncharacterized protein n=1 Tax=Polypedilum vanderplanki TaxID=319348 RepID=A0A9J6BGX6_POLVA|nr:hypothetical protein PVAND_016962 [Polypedilum vanderplanki]
MAFNIRDKIDIRGFAANFSYKKFLFVLHLETGGVFINSYNFWLSFVTMFCSFFIADFLAKEINTGLYVGSIFLYIFMMILSIISLKGMEDGSKIKFIMGLLPTFIWPILFFSGILAQIMKFKFSLEWIEHVNFWEGTFVKKSLISEGDVIGVLIIFMLFHIYCAVYFVVLYINKCRN